MAVEITQLGRHPDTEATKKPPEKCQHKGNGLSSSVTRTHGPLNNYSTPPSPQQARGRKVRGPYPLSSFLKRTRSVIA